MNFDRRTTAGLFVALIGLGTTGLLVSGVMAAATVMMMVLPAMVVFGLICLGLGTQYGKYRSGPRT
jgi:hypothetical protein